MEKEYGMNTYGVKIELNKSLMVLMKLELDSTKVKMQIRKRGYSETIKVSKNRFTKEI